MPRGGTLAAFDLDGTLHWTEKALVPAIQRAMEDMGVDPAPAERINSLYGEPLEEFCRLLLGRGPGSDCHLFRLGIRRHQKRTLPLSGELYPGVRELLERLRKAGASMAVISNAGEDYIRLVLNSFGIGDYFQSLLGADTGLSKALRLRSLLEPGNWAAAVMVGDRYHDLEAAERNGVPSIGCLYGYGSREELEPADILVESPAEVFDSMSRLGIL